MYDGQGKQAQARSTAPARVDSIAYLLAELRVFHLLLPRRVPTLAPRVQAAYGRVCAARRSRQPREDVGLPLAGRAHLDRAAQEHREAAVGGVWNRGLEARYQ